MSLAETIAEIRGARVQSIDVWKAAIERGVRACAAVKQGDVKAQLQPDVPANRWVSLNECMPDEAKAVDGSHSLEAWVDSEGVLDIEVPRDLSADLMAWVEECGLRCSRELDWQADRATLHVNLYLAPRPPIAEEPAAQVLNPDVADGGSQATGV